MQSRASVVASLTCTRHTSHRLPATPRSAPGRRSGQFDRGRIPHAAQREGLQGLGRDDAPVWTASCASRGASLPGFQELPDVPAQHDQDRSLLPAERRARRAGRKALQGSDRPRHRLWPPTAGVSSSISSYHTGSVIQARVGSPRAPLAQSTAHTSVARQRHRHQLDRARGYLENVSNERRSPFDADNHSRGYTRSPEGRPEMEPGT